MADQMVELVVKARGGDADAFAQLIERYERTALSVAYALLSHADAAGDAVQEGFLRAWQQLPRLQEVDRFGGWLMQIVRHVAIDMRRRRRKMGNEFGELVSHEEAPSVAGETRERSEKVQAALSDLDETSRTIVVLKYYEGLATKEIAEVVGISPAAVDMRLSRARGLLKAQLTDEWEGLGGADEPVTRVTGVKL